MNKNKEYIIFDPKVSAPLHTLSRKEAKEHFDLFVSSIDDRILELEKLMIGTNINLDFSLDSVKNIDEWFLSIVQENQNTKGVPDSFTFSLCNDISMYLGELIKKKCSNIIWKFNTFSKDDMSYQRPVLFGFNVKNKKYYRDLDFILCRHAYSILKGDKEKGFLIKVMDFTLSKC